MVQLVFIVNPFLWFTSVNLFPIAEVKESGDWGTSAFSCVYANFCKIGKNLLNMWIDSKTLKRYTDEKIILITEEKYLLFPWVIFLIAHKFTMFTWLNLSIFFCFSFSHSRVRNESSFTNLILIFCCCCFYCFIYWNIFYENI